MSKDWQPHAAGRSSNKRPAGSRARNKASRTLRADSEIRCVRRAYGVNALTNRTSPRTMSISEGCSLFSASTLSNRVTTSRRATSMRD